MRSSVYSDLFDFINLVRTILLYAILCPDTLFPESDKQIESYEKGFKPDNHVIGETPEKLIDEYPGLTYRLQLHIHEYRR